jgi:hypothetical protein
MRTFVAACLFVSLVPACSSDWGEGTYEPPVHPDDPGGSTGGEDPGRGEDPGGGEDPGETPSTTIRLAGGPVDVEVPFKFWTEANGTDRIGALSIASPTGTATYQGEPYTLYVDTFTKEPPFTYYSAWGVGAHGLFRAWFYCTENSVAWIYTMAPGQEGTFEEGDGGHCTEQVGTTAATIELPAMAMEYPTALIDSVDLDGAQIQLAGGTPGWIATGDRRAVILPWARSDDPDANLVELDTMFWDAAAGTLGLGTIDVAADEPGGAHVVAKTGLDLGTLAFSDAELVVDAAVTVRELPAPDGDE